MIKTKIALFFILLSLFYSFARFQTFSLENKKNFPQWLACQSYKTDQTSGITFIKKDDKNALYFLLCDDVGALWKMIIDSQDSLKLKKINWSESVEKYLSKFHKRDFEEIFFDKNENKVYLSIEGNSKNYLDEVGVYELFFYRNDIFSDSVIGIKKIDFQPEKIFLKHTDNNIGYEGFCCDKNYFYLGLEGANLSFEPDSLVRLHIADKKTRTILKTYDGLQLNLSSICGLEIIDERFIIIVDRNRRLLSFVEFDQNLNIIRSEQSNINISIPNYPDYEYVSTIESVSYVKEDNAIFLIDDPWPKFYVPPYSVLMKLDQQTQQNFKELVPIIHSKKIVIKK